MSDRDRGAGRPDDLPAEVADELRAMKAPADPPGELEGRILEAAREEGLVGAGRVSGGLATDDGARPSGGRPPGAVTIRSLPTATRTWLAAAAVLLVALGGVLGYAIAPGPGTDGTDIASETPEPRPDPVQVATAQLDEFFVLLIQGPEFDTDALIRDEAAMVNEYRQWGQGLAGEGRLVYAQRLEDDGGFLLMPDGVASDLVRDADPGILGGLFVVRAESYEQALEMVRASPHIRHGGRVALIRANSGAG